MNMPGDEGVLRQSVEVENVASPHADPGNMIY